MAGLPVLDAEIRYRLNLKTSDPHNMYITSGLYLYFIITNAETYYVGQQSMGEGAILSGDTERYLETLNRDFVLHPSWEAVGVSVLLDHRRDRHTIRAYISGDLLDGYKQT